MYSALILDDEQAALENLRALLEDCCPQISTIYTCQDVNEASRIILRHKPDIVFTDINMPEVSGIEFLKTFRQKQFHSIIVTAFADFGIEAVKAGASDYLMKPIISQELIDAVNRTIQDIEESQASLKRPELREEKSVDPAGQKLLIKSQGSTLLISFNEIIVLEAENNYTKIHCTGNRTYISPKTLKFHESTMDQTTFFRVHKSYLVNVDFFKSYAVGDSRTIYLENDLSVPVAINKRGEFRKFLTGKKK